MKLGELSKREKSGMPVSARMAKTSICNSMPYTGVALRKGLSSPTRHREQFVNALGWMLTFTNFVAVMFCWYGDSIDWAARCVTWSHLLINSRKWASGPDLSVTGYLRK